MSHVHKYRTITASAEALYKDRGSRFLAYAYPINNEAEVKAHLHLLREQYPDATHHCYAFFMKPDQSVFRFADDGEPNNSAGRPILRQLQSLNITNTLVVVVRYFGGTKLGVPGLIEAYGEAARLVLEQCQVTEEEVKSTWRITTAYAHENLVYRLIKQLKGAVVGREMDAQLHIQFSVAIAEEITLKKICAENPNFELMSV